MLALCAISTVHTASATTDRLARAISDLPGPSQTKVVESATRFLRARSAANQSVNTLGWDCMAANALYGLGVDGAKARLVDVALRLEAAVVRSTRSGKPIGWPAQSEANTVCSPRTGTGSSDPMACEGSEAVFAFQTGLGLACLAKANTILGRPALLETASQVMSYWSSLKMPVRPCMGCIYFATSDSFQHEQRYIRNMNLFMGYGIAVLAKNSNNSALRDIAYEVLEADIWEQTGGNAGYLGKLDSIWQTRKNEDRRIENHAASVALLAYAFQEFLPDNLKSKALIHASKVYGEWANCNESRCQSLGCKYWASDSSRCFETVTSVHCVFRSTVESAAGECIKYITGVPVVGGYGLWAILGAK